MRLRICVLFSIFLLAAAAIFIFASCDNGASSGTLTVGLTGIPSGADGHMLYMGLYEGDADPMSASLLGIGGIEIGVDNSDVLVDPITEAVVTYDPGDYDLYLWIDMNDNLNLGTEEPEQGIDMSHTSFPFDVTIDGDTTVTVIASAFELYPGFD